MTKRGCHISDIAPSYELNEKADAFISLEVLEMSQGYGKFQEKLLEESGLANESADTIIAMKTVMAEWRKMKQNKK